MTSWWKSRLGFEHPASAHHGSFDRDLDQRHRVHAHGVASEHHEVSQLPGGYAAFLVLFERRVRAVHGSHAQRLFHAHALPRSPDIAVAVGAGYLRSQRHHRFERPRRIVRCLGGADTGVQETAHREHPVQALRPVLLHLFAVIVHVGGERGGYGSERPDPLDERWIHYRAMLQAVARIAPRHLALEAFIDAQHDINRRVAVGVRADLPSGLVRLARIRVQLLFTLDQDAVIVGPSDVGLRKPGGPFRDGSVAHQLDRSKPDTVVTKSGADARGAHALEKLILDKAINAKEQLTGLARVLIGQKIFGSGFGIVHRGYALPHHHLGDQLDALAHLIPREIGWQEFAEWGCGVFPQTAGQPAGRRIAIELAARRIGNRVAYLGPLQSGRVDIGRVPAAVLDENWMLRSGGVEILAGQFAAFLGLGVVVFKTDDPVARECLRRPLADGILNFHDGAKIAIHPAQVPDARI